MNFSLEKFFANKPTTTGTKIYIRFCSSKSKQNPTVQIQEIAPKIKPNYTLIDEEDVEQSDDTSFETSDASSLLVSYFDKRFKSLEEKNSEKDDEPFHK